MTIPHNTLVSFDDIDADAWDAYVSKNKQGSVYHLSAFKLSVEKVYGHKSYYFALLDEQKTLCGVLPLFYVKSVIFGNALVAIPFCDYGGILADSEEIYKELYDYAVNLAKNINCKSLEFRQISEIIALQQDETCVPKTSKVRLSLPLPSAPDLLFQSFPSKLRSQVRKPQKDGCLIKQGHKELLDDFYTVLTHNMKELGSPVHDKDFFLAVLEHYKNSATIFIVYLEKNPIACSLVLNYKSVFVNPWASSDKRYRKNAPNMLLYWGMFEYAIEQGCTEFDFGRSTVDEGTYKFKKQWGAKSETLWWYSNDTNDKNDESQKWKKKLFISLWRILPTQITLILSSILRKQIPL